MCNPLAAGIAFSVGSTVAEGIRARNIQRKQEDANEDWENYQRVLRDQEFAEQDRLRNQAAGALNQTVEKFTPENVEAARSAEQDRLFDYLTEGTIAANSNAGQAADTIPAGDALLAGTASSGRTYEDATKQELARAAGEARGRIGALARLNSYSGSQGGLNQYLTNALTESGREIQRSGNLRRGSLNAYNVAARVPPKTYTYQPSPFTQVGNVLGQGLVFSGASGKSWEDIFGEMWPWGDGGTITGVPADTGVTPPFMLS